MTLKEFCTILKQCADKLEEEIKYNINDVHNVIYSNQLNETKLSLEKAKDYHYKEIMDGIAEILKNIKKIIFHQDKIEWLSNEGNFTKDELRRFTYVKRQVFAFSNNEETPSPVPSPSIKKEKRRTASEVSIGTLEAWEKYLDQKDVGAKEMEEKVAELKPLVPKRTLSNARRRKKFISSTMGGFLEGDGRSTNLDSIMEDASSTEENERLFYSQSLESLDQMALTDEQNSYFNGVLAVDSKASQNLSDTLTMRGRSKNGPLVGSLESLHGMVCYSDMGKDMSMSESGKIITEVKTVTSDRKIEDNFLDTDNLAINAELDSEIINIIKESTPIDEESIANEIMESFFDDSTLSDSIVEKLTIVEEPNKEKTKPKIVDVILKKKPT